MGPHGDTNKNTDLSKRNVLFGDRDLAAVIVNQAEYIRTADNISGMNQIYISNDTAILGVAKPEREVDVEATSFGSRTRCAMVINLCG